MPNSGKRPQTENEKRLVLIVDDEEINRELLDMVRTSLDESEKGGDK